MKKFLKIALVVILIITVILGALVVWQWSNIKAVFMALNYSAEEIDTLVVENEAKINEILNELTQTEMRPLTDDEMEMLLSGELSEEEAINIIKNGGKSSGLDANADESNQDAASKNDNQKKVSDSGDKSDTLNDSKKTTDDKTNKNNAGSSVTDKALNNGGKNTGNQKSSSKVDDIIARIYLLRAEYINALSGLESEAKSVASSIPKKDRTVSKKLDLIDAYTGRAVALEKGCDARMESLIYELESELRKTGGNVSMISEIRSVYASEKEVKKSQLLNKYNKYLK